MFQTAIFILKFHTGFFGFVLGGFGLVFNAYYINTHTHKQNKHTLYQTSYAHSIQNINNKCFDKQNVESYEIWCLMQQTNFYISVSTRTQSNYIPVLFRVVPWTGR